MQPSDRLAYYKRLQSSGIALSGSQQSDMLQIMKERGAASSYNLPAGGAKHEEAKRKL